jgi:hypothetical protein
VPEFHQGATSRIHKKSLFRTLHKAITQASRRGFMRLPGELAKRLQGNVVRN